MNKTKTGFQFMLWLLVALFVFSFGLPALADGEEVTPEAAPTAVSLPAEEAPVDNSTSVVVVDNDTAWIDGKLITWGGWVGTVVFAGLFLVAIKELIKSGNLHAQNALKFFEASRDMLPVDKWQGAFEKRAKETATPLDDIAAAATKTVLNQMGILNQADSRSDVPIEGEGR